MIISIASDHAGFKYKEKIKKHLETKGHEVVDFGTDSEESCDYPDFILPAAGAVANGEAQAGIVLGGSGNGEAMAANKVKGIRCAVCWSKESALLAKQHNNANMISLGQRMIEEDKVLDIVDSFFGAAFEGDRHAARIQKITDAEK